jgi:hypothetical protein
VQRHGHVVQLDPAQRCGPDAHAGVGLDGQALGGGFDDEHGGLAVELGRDDEQFGVGGRGYQRLHAREAVAAGGPYRGGPQRGRIEQCVRFGDGDACLRHVVARELVEVRGLLVRAAPVGQRRRDATGCQDGQRLAHVAVRERLGDQCVGDGAAVLGDAVEVLGDVDRGDAEFGGLGDQSLRVRRVGVGVVGGRPQDLLGELGHGLDDHLLVVVGSEVEVIGAAGLQPGRCLAAALYPLELTGGGAQGRERCLDAVAQATIQRVTQPVAVQELLSDEGCDEGKPDGRHGALGPLQADAAFGSGASGTLVGSALGRQGVGHVAASRRWGSAI